MTRSGAKVTPIHLESPIIVEPLREPIKQEEKEKTTKEEKEKTTKEETEKKKETIPPLGPGIYKPKVPFPQRLKAEKLKEKYSKFLELIKQVHINVPLTDLIKGMPNYGRFIKDLVSNKKKLEEITCAQALEEVSTTTTKMPPKLGDTGSFTIPCYFGDILICNALADLGASINLMPMTLFKELGLIDLKSTKMTVQLADRSVKYPIGIAENVPVRVDKFIFPVDFVIMDMDKDSKVPIILGRPFLNTADAVIHVTNKTLSLGVGQERVLFSIDKAMKQSNAFDDTCNHVDLVDECVHNTISQAFS